MVTIKGFKIGTYTFLSDKYKFLNWHKFQEEYYQLFPALKILPNLTTEILKL